MLKIYIYLQQLRSMTLIMEWMFLVADKVQYSALAPSAVQRISIHDQFYLSHRPQHSEMILGPSRCQHQETNGLCCFLVEFSFLPQCIPFPFHYTTVSSWCCEFYLGAAMLEYVLFIGQEKLEIYGPPWSYICRNLLSPENWLPELAQHQVSFICLIHWVPRFISRAVTSALNRIFLNI